jgi:hypothetical protein
MRKYLLAAVGISVASAVGPCFNFAPLQAATLSGQSGDAVPQDVIYPDAVTCDLTSPAGIIYKVIFYKGQTISFASEPNNAAEYGTTFIRDSDNFDAKTPYKWRLQMGKPGNITILTLPSGWTTDNCPIGKTIDNLRADKQALKIFTTQ